MVTPAMTSGLASDSDKFKIIITLRRAQKFGHTGPYKNFDFFVNRLYLAFFRNFELKSNVPKKESYGSKRLIGTVLQSSSANCIMYILCF